MKAFTELYLQIESLKDEGKIMGVLSLFLRHSAKEDQLWAIALVLDKSPKRITTIAKLKDWVKEEFNIPEWLFEESLLIAGDRIETISLIGRNQDSSGFTLSECCRNILSLDKSNDEDIKAFVLESWNSLSEMERFVFNKIVTGGLRIKISVRLLTKALSPILEVSENVLANRLNKPWSPGQANFDDLLLRDSLLDSISSPYPFYLGTMLNESIREEVDLKDLFYEPKWQGLRCQFIKRKGHIFIWSRQGDLVTHKFPELDWMKTSDVKDFVMDGSIIPVENNKPISYSALERRLKLKRTSKKIIDDIPIAFVAYDLLELNGKDIREQALTERRSNLEELVQEMRSPEMIWVSPMDMIRSWDKLNQIRKQSRIDRTDGVIVKHKDAKYDEGRVGNHWRKWKNDPLEISAVLIYVQSEPGRGISGIKEGTFAVWDDDTLVPIGRIKLDLAEEDMKELASWSKTNVIEKFGPVRSVNAAQVFKIGFEEVTVSARRKSGLILKNPFVVKWLKDNDVNSAHSLSNVKEMML